MLGREARNSGLLSRLDSGLGSVGSSVNGTFGSVGSASGGSVSSGLGSVSNGTSASSSSGGTSVNGGSRGGSGSGSGVGHGGSCSRCLNGRSRSSNGCFFFFAASGQGNGGEQAGDQDGLVHGSDFQWIR